MALRIPRLDVEQHEIDHLELRVGDAVAINAVRVQGRVDAHGLRSREEFHREAMLHQRFSSTEGEAARHDLQAAPVFAQLFGGFRDGHGDAVAHGPRVRVVTVETPKHAARRPGNHAHPGAVHGRAGRERMEESHVAGGERGPDVRFRNVLPEVDAKLEWTLRRQRLLRGRVSVRHGGQAPWNVRLMTSICWSRVSRTKLTA